MNVVFKGKRVDFNDEYGDSWNWVKGHYFKTPLTNENVQNGDGNFFLCGEVRHCISTETGIVYEVIPETITVEMALITINPNELKRSELFAYLRRELNVNLKNLKELGHPEFRLIVETNGHAYIHVFGRDSETFDFEI